MKKIYKINKKDIKKFKILNNNNKYTFNKIRKHIDKNNKKS